MDCQARGTKVRFIHYRETLYPPASRSARATIATDRTFIQDPLTSYTRLQVKAAAVKQWITYKNY